MISAVRRTTLVVGDIEKSLAFYKEALGLKVFYDQEIAAVATGRLLGVPGARVRLVSLQGGESVSGMVGLLSFRSHAIAPRREIAALGLPLDTALLFMAPELDIAALYGRARAAGAAIVSPPIEYEIPRRGPATGFTCKDPDGVLVAVMRFGPLAPDGKTAAVGAARRTTIVVDDMEASLAFYRDTLGLKVFYDQEIASEGEARLLGVPGAQVRIASLQSADSVEGMVGLMAFKSPAFAPRRLIREKAAAPDVFLIFLTERIREVYARLSAAGVPIQCPPIEYEIPGRGISAGLTCFDPNGIVVEFTQFGPIG
jgi:catechol 2,3-dioxygenase-like lactoylglutathione lyase family enzyme